MIWIQSLSYYDKLDKLESINILHVCTVLSIGRNIKETRSNKQENPG